MVALPVDYRTLRSALMKVFRGLFSSYFAFVLVCFLNFISLLCLLCLVLCFVIVFVFSTSTLRRVAEASCALIDLRVVTGHTKVKAV